MYEPQDWHWIAHFWAPERYSLERIAVIHHTKQGFKFMREGSRATWGWSGRQAGKPFMTREEGVAWLLQRMQNHVEAAEMLLHNRRQELANFIESEEKHNEIQLP